MGNKVYKIYMILMASFFLLYSCGNESPQESKDSKSSNSYTQKIRTVKVHELDSMKSICKNLISKEEETIYKDQIVTYDLQFGKVLIICPLKAAGDSYGDGQCSAKIFLFSLNEKNNWEIQNNEIRSISGNFGGCDFDKNDLKIIYAKDKIVGYFLHWESGPGGWYSESISLFHISNEKLVWDLGLELSTGDGERSEYDAEYYQKSSSYYFEEKDHLKFIVDSREERGSEIYEIKKTFEFKNKKFVLEKIDTLDILNKMAWSGQVEKNYEEYLKNPNLLDWTDIYDNKFSNAKFNLLGWSENGNKIALRRGNTSCYEGFCDFSESYEIYDFKSQKKIVGNSYNTGNDGVSFEDLDQDLLKREEKANKKTLIAQMRDNKIIPTWQTFHSGSSVSWGGEFSIFFNGDKLCLQKKSKNENQFVKTIHDFNHSEMNDYRILGYFKSPINKSILIVVKYEGQNASGIDEQFDVFKTELNNF